MMDSIETPDPINGKYTRVNIEFKKQRTSDSCAQWLEVLHAFGTHQNERIACAMALFVDREMIRPRFMHEMLTATGILRDIAIWIFDRYGRLREEHKLGQKNTVENWEKKLDHGPLLVLHSFWVSKKWRRMGLARIMIHKLVKRVEALQIADISMLAVPGGLPTEVFEELLAQNAIAQPSSHNTDGLEAKFLLCSMGFRRIGSTPCFAVRIGPGCNEYSINKSAYEDVDEGETTYGVSEILWNENRWVHGPENRIGLPFGDWEDQLKWFEQMKERRPILHATVTLPDSDLRNWYCENANDFKTKDWLTTDHMGRNVLHLAVIGIKYQSLRWLLETLNVGTCNELRTARNMRRQTPLQNLYWRLEEIRTTDGELALSDKFEGFGEDAKSCLSMLECLELPQPGDVLPPREVAFWMGHFSGQAPDALENLGAKFSLSIPWSATKDYEGVKDKGEPVNLATVGYSPPSHATAVRHANVSAAGSRTGNKALLTLKIDRHSSPADSPNRIGRIITGERLKYGCSCYMCLQGVMSYRLRFVLFIQATYLKEMLEQNEPTDHYHKFWDMMLTFWSERVSWTAAQSYRESRLRHIRDATIFRAIARVVGPWKELPTISAIRRRLEYDQNNHIWLENPMRSDPAIRTALRVLFEFIQDQDEHAGTGRFGQSMAIYYRDAMELIDPCRNDKEYGFVARMCEVPLNVPFNEFCFVKKRKAREGNS